MGFVDAVCGQRLSAALVDCVRRHRLSIASSGGVRRGRPSTALAGDVCRKRLSSESVSSVCPERLSTSLFCSVSLQSLRMPMASVYMECAEIWTSSHAGKNKRCLCLQVGAPPNLPPKYGEFLTGGAFFLDLYIHRLVI